LRWELRAARISCGWIKQLTFLDFEQPPRIEPKPPHVSPFRAVAASARGALGILLVQGADAVLEPVVLGAQADKGSLLQAARVKISAPRVGQATVRLPSR
jgi:hypothetical protein